MRLSGWGNHPVVDARLERYREPQRAAQQVQVETALIPRGNGRAYGDAALSTNCVLSTLPSNRILILDLERGKIRCEAGLLLSDLLDVLVPLGWFVPVTPGTRFVTIGGMVAADVHGKNHHLDGSFCDHVEELLLVDGQGSCVTCSSTLNDELFRATCGGMGLTGVVVEVAFQLQPIQTAGIVQETRPAPCLHAVMEQFAATESWPYSVAWIDCLAQGRSQGRSLLYLGRHARADDLPTNRDDLSLVRKRRASGVALPFNLPASALNRRTISAFNALYYARGVSQSGQDLVGINPFFYPLDGVLSWNRLYGRRGFTQYQCVLPMTESRRGLERLLARIAAAGLGSFLAVLKVFGDQSSGLLSFPLKGYTLALDFPWSQRVLDLMVELDHIVLDHGGRLYLAKDARMPPAMLAAGYPQLERFRAVRRRWDPEGRFQSLQSRRLGI